MAILRKAIDQKITPSGSTVQPPLNRYALFATAGGLGVLNESGSQLNVLATTISASSSDTVNPNAIYEVALTASYAISSSKVELSGIIAPFNLSASIAVTASWSPSATTSSFVAYAATASYFATNSIVAGKIVEPVSGPLTGISITGSLLKMKGTSAGTTRYSKYSLATGPSVGHGFQRVIVLEDKKILVAAKGDASSYPGAVFFNSSANAETFQELPFAPSATARPTKWVKVLETVGNIFALGDNGILYVIGDNYDGQCGNGSSTDITDGLRPITALNANGQLVVDVWATNSGDSTATYCSVAACVKKTNNKYLYVAWGGNQIGQLGLNSSTTQIRTPTAATTEYDGPIQNVVFSFENTQCSTMRQGDATVNPAYSGLVVGAGYNAFGQLGSKNATNVNYFTFSYLGTTTNFAYASSSLQTVTSATSYRSNSTFIGHDKYAYMVGDNSYGQLGNGTTTTSTSTGFTAVKRGSTTYVTNVKKSILVPGGLVTLDTNGTVYAVGRNTSGYWGTGAAVNATNTYAGLVATVVRDIWAVWNYREEVTFFYNKFISTGGTYRIKTYAAGSNVRGQCGIGSNTTNITSATEITLPYNDYFIAIKGIGNSASTWSAMGVMGLTNSGRVYTWGSMGAAPLGGLQFDSAKSLYVPMQIVDLQNI